MIPLRKAIRWRDRLLDATTLTLSGCGTYLAFSALFGPIAATTVLLGCAAIATAAQNHPLPDSDAPSSERGRRLLSYFTERANLQPLAYREVPRLKNSLAEFIAARGLELNRKLARRASTPMLAGTIAHELGHLLYGRQVSNTLKMITAASSIGLLPAAGLAVAGGSIMLIAGMAGAAVSSYLLMQMQQRNAELACDRVATILAGERGLIQAIEANPYKPDNIPLVRSWQQNCRPHSLAEQAVNLLDSHPPLHMRATAMHDYARTFSPHHTGVTELELEDSFGHLSRRITRPQRVHKRLNPAYQCKPAA